MPTAARAMTPGSAAGTMLRQLLFGPESDFLVDQQHVVGAFPLEETPRDVPEWESLLRPEVRKRQALARKGMSQYAPPSRAHVLAQDLMMRAIQLPVVKGLAQRAAQSSL